MCVSRMREPVGLRPDAEEKHTLNLSFNINPWLAHCMGASGRLAPLSSCAPAGARRTRTLRASLLRSSLLLLCFAAESARGGTLMSLSEGAALCEPQVPSAHATPAEGLQVLGLVVAAFGERNLVDDL